MNISTLSLLVFSSQFNLNNTDGETASKITPTKITSIDKIINTFINYFISICLKDKKIRLIFFHNYS